MFADYHTHSLFSFDADDHAWQMAAAAEQMGLEELCFTDHLDFDQFPIAHVPDYAAREAELERLRALHPALTIRLGAEVSLRDDACAQRARAAMEGYRFDFILGSLHTIHGRNTWTKEFYVGMTKSESYRLYLETLWEAVRSFPEFHVLGHYDFIAKYAPYPDRSVTLAHAPEVFDALLRYLAENGKSLEINTASWREDKPWGEDILRRYRELGGEFVTIGSDAHDCRRLGRRFDEAREVAKAAGIKYLAAFDNGRPVFHPL